MSCRVGPGWGGKASLSGGALECSGSNTTSRAEPAAHAPFTIPWGDEEQDWWSPYGGDSPWAPEKTKR